MIRVKGKVGILLIAAVLAFGSVSLAKEKGNLLSLPNWGVITVPAGLYMEPGQQTMLTAKEYDGDVAAMLETIYPIEPVTYQLVLKDDAAFQYGYLLRYSTDVWAVEAAASRRKKENAYLRDIGDRPDMKTLMARAAERMKEDLPDSFRIVSPLTEKKVKGRLFYECTLKRRMVINETAFDEAIRVIAWQHGTTIEIAVLMAEENPEKGNLLDTMTAAFETADKMPKK